MLKVNLNLDIIFLGVLITLTNSGAMDSGCVGYLGRRHLQLVGQRSLLLKQTHWHSLFNYHVGVNREKSVRISENDSQTRFEGF